jgi:dynein heavy chain
LPAVLLPLAAGTVMFTFSDWYKTPWDKIDVDFLVEETKKLSKDIKTLNKAVGDWFLG